MALSTLLNMRLLAAGALLAAAGPASAQAPTIIGLSPAANTAALPRTGALTVTFSQPLTAASAGALRVYGNQRGGLRTRGTTPAAVLGPALSFAPGPRPYLPGEEVQYTVTRAATSTGGAALARPWVGRFTAAVSGPGNGHFGPTATTWVDGTPYNVALGDADNDGDLDLFVCMAGSVDVLLRLNDGKGHFGGGQRVSGGYNPSALVLADVNGDGWLDLLAVNFLSQNVTVSLNDGRGGFGNARSASAGALPLALAVADLDGDGDLDLAIANGGVRTVSVRMNDGTGAFSGTQDLPTTGQGDGVALGDVDQDGDVDLVALDSFGATADVFRNDGSGTFGPLTTTPIARDPRNVALVDVDHDGDLDLLANSEAGQALSVRLNDGTGNFGGGQDVPLGFNSWRMTIGDLNGDGHPDAAVVCPNDSVVSVCFNDGAGRFDAPLHLPMGHSPYGVATADVDGDGDLDLVAANFSGAGLVSVRLNEYLAPEPTAPTTGPLELYPNPTAGSFRVLSREPDAPVRVFNSAGRQVLAARTNATGAATLLLPTDLAPGLYLVKAGAHTQRLVVE
ncbi:FG-GAP-like repeat-containing protein [Hymenobacter monticola]|uniref:T9SS type A sorting domain-containing protein n=1 Tax=Hymenobacter monticola TaxID=1705399 RepID=A0ABY4B782_9BACT|nr:T9SS type A sorting domain-containing protein [Hymenobacter monticola]UOE35032.1 T9SS type A sorting domain-containing protein [Hymenobacter monticola]